MHQKLFSAGPAGEASSAPQIPSWIWVTGTVPTTGEGEQGSKGRDGNGQKRGKTEGKDGDVVQF